MKAYQLQAYNSLDALKLIDLSEPNLGKNDVLVKIRANSLNYRELIVLRGGYDRNKKLPVIPASDGVGEVADIGDNVTTWQKGDRVASAFFRDWTSGKATETQMNYAISLNRLKPVVDRVIPFSETKQAYKLLESGKHLGKIVISHA